MVLHIKARWFCKKTSVFFLVSFLLSVTVVGWVTWPLLPHAFEGIGSSHRPEVGGAREMIAGDHLQLLYFFNLGADFVSGDTPWFHNLYEFNEGDDAARKTIDFYYMPFSLIYGLGRMVGGMAFGWNFAGLIGFWLSAWGACLLARRFVDDGFLASLAGIVSILLPYRLVTFLQGSPTGFGMAYVPFFMLGLDLAIRGKRMGGGLLAGACLFFSGWIDIHVFFFLGLLTPFWCLFVFLYSDESWQWKRIGRIAKAMIPFVVFCLLVLLQAWYVSHQLSDSAMAGGRSIGEILLFSPSPSGVFSGDPNHASSYIYLPRMLLVMLGVVFVTGISGLIRDRSRPQVLRLVLALGLILGACGIVLLALGPRMPIDAATVWWERLCRVVPPYAMIRQPAKVYILLPGIIAVLLVLPLSWCPSAWMKWFRGGMLALVLGLAIEVNGRIDPSIALLDNEQEAYAAIVADAAARDIVPRAVAVVLWPGDSHWSSLYEYYGAKYRIRMLNGYSPNVARDYIDNVFYRFEALNQGYADDQRLDALQSMGIDYLVLHEDAFPEKVSPFGVAQTLQGFLRNPRLALLAHDRAVWSFRIDDSADPANRIDPEWDIASITYRWDAERLVADASLVHEDAMAHGAQFVRLAPGNGALDVPDWGLVFQPDLRCMLRIRGQGQLRAVCSDAAQTERIIPLATDEWAWVSLESPVYEGFQSGIGWRIESLEGMLDIDYVFMARGRLPLMLEVGDDFWMPAPTLFHAGYTDLTTDEVWLEPERVPAGVVFYGPRLPLPIGHYDVELHYRMLSEQQGGGGVFGIRDRQDGVALINAVGEHQVSFRFDQNVDLPVTFALDYARAGTLALRGIRIKRLR